MDNNKFGNRITDNALSADNGVNLIQKALSEIKSKYGWQILDSKPLFKGVYYDSQKVGSFIVQVKNNKKQIAVLKLQLRPLPFDEGFIIRRVEQCNKSSVVRLPKILQDEAWNKKLGYGYLIFEDLSFLPNLWLKAPATAKEMKLHKFFLQEFLHKVLPVKSWLPKSKISIQRAYKDSFEHFYSIAQNSNHHHISDDEIQKIKEKFFQVIAICHFEPIHFTHAHLGGGDIKYDEKNNQFIVLANLYWSFRPQYQEIIFPIWTDLLLTKKQNYPFGGFLKRVKKWTSFWSKDLYNHNPADKQQYWFNLLERATMTIMLDLGSSEWRGDKTQNQKLFENWKRFFWWVVKEKF